MEVLRRNSKDLGAFRRIDRLTRYLDQQGRDERSGEIPLPHADHQPYKLSQRLSAETVDAIIRAYQAGATTREVGERFGWAHSSINKLLRQHGITARRRSPNAAEMQGAVELYEAGLGTRTIGQLLGFGATTIGRALRQAGVQLRPRFGR